MIPHDTACANLLGGSVKLRENGAREQHGVSAASFKRWEDDGRPLALEASDQCFDDRRADIGMVNGTDERAFDRLARQGFEPSKNGRQHAVAIVFVHDDANVAEVELTTKRLSVVANHDDDGPRRRRAKNPQQVAEKRAFHAIGLGEGK